MKIDILTLFPEMVEAGLSTSILGRARRDHLVELAAYNLRDWAIDKHRTVDDRPYGGGAGMVLKVDVIDRALADLKKNSSKPHVILLTPQGKPFSQKHAQQLTKHNHLILIAGHYEGFDERVRLLVDEEISIGDYVLTGGELPALVITDAVSRLLPGVLGDATSPHEESFSLTEAITQTPLLEYPHYTRPESYLSVSIKGDQPLVVPEVLTSGHAANIAQWRIEQAKERTKKRRLDLFS